MDRVARQHDLIGHGRCGQLNLGKHAFDQWRLYTRPDGVIGLVHAYDQSDGAGVRIHRVADPLDVRIPDGGLSDGSDPYLGFQPVKRMPCPDDTFFRFQLSGKGQIGKSGHVARTDLNVDVGCVDAVKFTDGAAGTDILVDLYIDL